MTRGLWLGALLCARAGVAAAQRAPDARATVRLDADNDFLAVRGAGPPPDYDYTHGTRLSLTWPDAPRWAAYAFNARPACTTPGRSGPACVLSSVAIAQEIYTPRHNVAERVSGDRPFAAWLYGATRIERLSGPAVHAFELRAGVVGPAALGESVQNGVHRLLGNHRESGWANQLSGRMAASIDYDVTRVMLESRGASPSRFVAADVGATVGTVRQVARAGVMAHYGFGALRTWSPDAAIVALPSRFSIDVGYREALVVHDDFIEGRGATPGAERLPWVGEASAALGWRLQRCALRYRYVSRGREYRAEAGRHAFGSISFSALLP